jgi:hypothetical protein
LLFFGSFFAPSVVAGNILTPLATIVAPEM